MASTAESELSFRSDEEWLSASQESLRAINGSVGLYQREKTLETLASVFTGHFRMSKDSFSRAPKLAKLAIKSQVKENFSRAYENILTGIVPANERQQFIIPEEMGNEAFSQITRRHLGKTEEYWGKLSALPVNSPKQNELAMNCLMNLAALGTIIMTRVPKGLNADAFRAWYYEADEKILENISKLAAVQEVPVVEVQQKSASWQKVESLGLSDNNPELQEIVRKISSRPIEFLLKLTALSKFPESAVSGSATGARSERKGGHFGTGVTQRFKSLFLTPLDASHPFLSGSSPKNFENRRAVARLRAFTQLVGLGFIKIDDSREVLSFLDMKAMANDPNLIQAEKVVDSLSLIMVEAATSGSAKRSLSAKEQATLKALVGLIAEGELKGAPFGFFGIGEALTKNSEHQDSQKFMNLVNEVFRDLKAREKYGLSKYDPNG